MIEFYNIDEFGTNFPKEIMDPEEWGAESRYRNLAKVQKEQYEKKQKEKLLQQKTKVSGSY